MKEHEVKIQKKENKGNDEIAPGPNFTPKGSLVKC